MPIRPIAACLVLALAGLASAAGAQTADAPPNARVVSDLNDVMDGQAPKLPSFPKLAPKRGYLRGYVKDASGKPLAGAYVMVLPPALFGGMTKRSVSARTDEKGLYEVPIPSAGCQVWCAGYALNYNGVRLALPLHPADGEFDLLSKEKGSIENFVLLTYGVANPSTVSENPVYGGGYYGASFTVGFSTREPGDTGLPQTWLELGSEIEITLTPDGPLADGTPGRPLVIRQKITPRSYFQVNDVPVGRYKVRARVTEGGKTLPLRLKENVRTERKGGLTPKETEDTATVVFRSATGDPATLRVPGGNMERLELLVERIP